MANNKQPFSKRKIIWVATILMVAGAYEFGHPYLEKQFDVDLPSLRESNDAATVEENDSGSAGSKSNGWQLPVGDSDQGNQKNQSTATRSSGNKKSYLSPTGKKNRLQSPAGLVYGVGGGGEHRVDHVMRHAQDDKARPVHSVFDGSQEEILKVIDEAYELIKSKSKRVRSKKDDRLDFRMSHVVDMQKRIGYLGGKRGQRENHPPRSKITLVLDNGKFVVTAYPDR